MDNNWVGIIEHPVNGRLFGCTEEHLEAYWDNQFRAADGYEKIGKVDFTKNCHAHAFGVADWPHTAVELLNLQAPAGSGPIIHIACYEDSAIKDATVASDPPYHSIKIVGGTCPIAQPPGQPVPGIPGQPVAPVAKDVIKESTQKFCESAVYRQTANCPNSVDLNTAKKLKGYNLKPYKQKKKD